MKNLEQIAALLALAVIGYLFYTKPTAATGAYSTGGNGVPYFLSYNVPLYRGNDLTLPSLTSGLENAQSNGCALCKWFGLGNTATT